VRYSGRMQYVSCVIEHTGRVTIHFVASLADTISFAATIFFKLFDRKAYNSAVRSVLVHQIYYTSVQILPLFLSISVILGSLTMGVVLETTKEFGLDRYLGNVLVGFALNEVSPFITVLLLALRSGSAINTEIATMKVNRELDTLKAFNIDANVYLFFPRIVNGMISLVLLNGLFSIVLLTSGFLFSTLLFGMSLTTYSTIVADAIHPSIVIIFILKCVTFGFFITLIPIRSGMRASYELTSIPVAVLHGMIRVFIAIVVIEVLSLIAISI